MFKDAIISFMAIVFYDGFCTICGKVVTLLKRMSSIDLDLQPVFAGENRKLVEYGLTQEDVNHAMWLVEPAGIKLGGYEAFKHIFLNYSTNSILKTIFKLKLSSWLGPKIYKYFARNRSHFGCKNSSCKI